MPTRLRQANGILLSVLLKLSVIAAHPVRVSGRSCKFVYRSSGAESRKWLHLPEPQHPSLPSPEWKMHVFTPNVQSPSDLATFFIAKFGHRSRDSRNDAEATDWSGKRGLLSVVCRRICKTRQVLGVGGGAVSLTQTRLYKTSLKFQTCCVSSTSSRRTVCSKRSCSRDELSLAWDRAWLYPMERARLSDICISNSDTPCLPLHPTRPVAAHQLFNLRHGHTIEVTHNRMFERGGCDGEFEALLPVFIGVEAVNEC